MFETEESERIYDELVDEFIGWPMEVALRAELEDLMSVGVRVDMDVELIPDCDSHDNLILLGVLQKLEYTILSAMRDGFDVMATMKEKDGTVWK